MSDSSSAPAAPNYSPIINSLSGVMNQASGYASSQYDWAKNQYATDQGVTYPIVNQQSGTATNQLGFGENIQNQYQDTYMPLENQFANEASNYASNANIQTQMGTAQATAAQTQDAARQNTEQTLQSYGVNPASGRYAGTEAALQAQKAAAIAGAGNTARQATINTGLGLQATAIGQGQTGATLGNTAVNTGISAGSQAVTNQLATTASGASTEGTAPQYMSAATGAGAVATQAMNAQYQDQLAQFEANQNASSGWGSLAGIGFAGISALKGTSLMPLTFAKRGGAVPVDDVPGNDGTQGGFLNRDRSPSGGAVTDDIPARSGNQAINLNAGEFIIPRDVVQHYGTRHFTKLIQQARKEAHLPQQPIGFERREPV